MKKNLRLPSILFALYIIICLYIFFFSRMGHPQSHSLQEYLRLSTNFIPFNSIYSYFTIPVKSWGMTLLHVVNIGGPVLLYLPLGIFLPLLFKKLQRQTNFLISVVCIILVIECVQLFTQLGSFNIDTIIFGTGGALIGFIACKKIISNRQNALAKSSHKTSLPN